jgi:hypothetical protein
MRLGKHARRCVEVIAMLDIPDPFVVTALVRQIAAGRGRPIVLKPITTGDSAPSGFWVAARTKDYICYEADTAKLHQEHIILHELGHMVCEHNTPADSHELLAQILLPTLDPAVVRKVLARTAYSHPEEEQAELFATLVLGQAGRFSIRKMRASSPEMLALLDRIEQAIAPTKPR